MSSNSEPPLDLSDRAVKKFIEEAKARGYASPRDVRALLPRNVSVSPKQMGDAMAMLACMGIQEEMPPPTEMFSFANVRPLVAEPKLEGLSINGRPYTAKADMRQGMHLAASGTLTQFNAILTVILGVLLASEQPGVLKMVTATALGLHVLAALVFCWAARPVTSDPVRSKAAEVVAAYNQAHHTFRNYRRGWRVTLLALLASAGVACLFVINAFGISL